MKKFLRAMALPVGLAGTKRVLILGDLLTFGSGVADNDAVFMRRLEEQLNAHELPVPSCRSCSNW